MGRMVIKKQEESVLETEVTRVKPPPLFKVMLLTTISPRWISWWL
jgi:hypothetical protein